MCSKPIICMRWLKSNSKWMKHNSYANGSILVSKSLSSGEAFAALKPFFFAVHPDRFGQFPKEREINEDSLKRLNEYIATATDENSNIQQNFSAFITSSSTSHLTFYLQRNIANDRATPTSIPSSVKALGDFKNDSKGSFQTVRVELGQRDVRRTVHSILKKCNLSTSYIDNLPHVQSQKTSSDQPRIRYTEPWTDAQDRDYEEQAEKDIVTERAIPDDLETWLHKNVQNAKMKLEDALPFREEIVRLRESLCKTLEVNDIIWDCGWRTQHFRGCLESLQSLADHHPETMQTLKGKTIVFGAETGVSMNGDIVLYSGEVRRNWLDVIRNLKQHDERILKIPTFQKALSRSLQDIKVVHRKFEPQKLAQTYENQLKKLTTSLGDYRGRQNYPSNWPERLSHLELVVETEAGPLMVSPTGQIIVPSSCPPFLLISFITEHMEEASQKLAQYKTQKYEEKELHECCKRTLGLIAFEKADNITPSLMIENCKRLLNHASKFSPLLTGTHLVVTTYYSVLTEGEMCIPWNWK